MPPNPVSFYSVYEHWRTDTNECFYVGKGKWRRVFDLHERNDRHRKIVAKVKRLGFNIDIRPISVCMTEEAALSFERGRIAYWRSLGNDLANIEDGGESRSGYVPSPETREKMRLAKLGTKQTPETIRKRVLGMMGHKCYTAGKPLSEETKAKLREASRGNQYAKGYKSSAELNEARSRKLKGRQNSLGTKMTEEFKAGVAVASRERWLDPAFREKMSNIRKEIWRRRKETVAA